MKAFYLSIDAKDGPNGNKTVNIRWAIQGIYADYVFTLENIK